MGRYASLNADTKDIVNCLLPGIAANFKVDNVVDIIPQDIRMRAWDCDRRKHIVGQNEDDPRNWGVQFLKDLVTISRLNSGNLTEFQEKLRAKIVTHDDDHPWCRLADIKEIREDYEAPPPRAGEKIEVSSSDDSTSGDSYFEELAEPDRVPGKKGRKPRNHEVYEARPQKQPKKRKSKYGTASQRLRRDSSTAWERQDPSKRRRREHDGEFRGSSTGRGVSVMNSEREDSINLSVPAFLTPSISASPGAYSRRGRSNSYFPYSIDAADDDSLSTEELKAQLAAAEAELKVTKLRLKIIAAQKLKAVESVETGRPASIDEPHPVD